MLVSLGRPYNERKICLGQSKIYDARIPRYKTKIQL